MIQASKAKVDKPVEGQDPWCWQLYCQTTMDLVSPTTQVFQAQSYSRDTVARSMVGLAIKLPTPWILFPLPHSKLEIHLAFPLMIGL